MADNPDPDNPEAAETLPEPTAWPGDRLTRTEAGATNRRTGAQTLTGADHDHAAAQHFLNEFRASPATQRRYATEITRLFRWAERQGKDEMTAYQASARGGVVKVRACGERVKLCGQAVTVMRGELM